MVVEGKRYGWKTCAGMFEAPLSDSIQRAEFSNDVVFINLTDYRQCDQIIRKADLVAGMLPDAIMIQVADLCIANKKSFITSAKLSRQMLSRKFQVEENEMLLLMECGFAPGLDHVTARKAIDNIHTKGGRIESFKSFHGCVVAESSIDNPWEFKLMENVNDVVQIGKQNNRYLHEGKIYHVPYHHLFNRAQSVSIKGLRDLVVIPEGDALYMRKIYHLHEASTVMRGRILRKGFLDIWRLLVMLGFTDAQSKVEMFRDSSFHNYLKSLLPPDESGHLEQLLNKYLCASDEDILKLRYLGLFDQDWVHIKEPTPAAILQFLLERKFKPETHDKDCLLMEHELEYVINDVRHIMKATLVAQGENVNDLALTKATGLTVGAALKAFLLDNIKVRGLHIPTIAEIYDPMLNELDDLGFAFYMEEHKDYSTPDDVSILKVG